MAQIVLFAVALSLSGAMVTQPRKSHPSREDWKRSTFGKGELGRVGVEAGVGQLAGHPRNYGGGMKGFGKRLGAGFAAHAVGTTVEHVVAAPLHEDLHYHRSNQRGFGPRLGHALKSTVVARNTRSGKHQAAVGKLSGHAAAGAFSQAVLHAGSGAATAGIGLGAEAGANVAREFWPHHKQLRARR